MRFLEETGSNRFRFERDKTTHTPAEFEAIYKSKFRAIQNLGGCDAEEH
jgi:hypothetical protein